MIQKNSKVRTHNLDPKFKTHAADPIDVYFRKSGITGVVSYPVYETLNQYWYVIHDHTEKGAVYHERELEIISMIDPDVD